MLQALEPVFDALDFRFQQIAEIVKTLVHGITEIVDTRGHGIAKVVDPTVEMRYAPALEINSQQVAADDNSDGSPLVDNRVHLG